MFALKEMDSLSKWADETKALNRFRGDNLGHEHIIRLLFSYKYQGKGYLIFPLAEGDLEHYWKTNASPSDSAKEAYWLVEQCTGIASALGKIHNHLSFPESNRGRHGDIKPQNLLWFRKPAEDHGLLVVADLTMTRFHSDGTVENTTSRGRAMTLTYRPPEVDVDVRTKSSQAFDIWSLGCVYLEYIVWYILGYDATRHSQKYLNASQQMRPSFFRARVIEDDWRKGGVSRDKFFNIRDDGPGGQPIAEVKESVRKVRQCLLLIDVCTPQANRYLSSGWRFCMPPKVAQQLCMISCI